MIYLNLEAPYEWVLVEGARVEAFGEVPTAADYSISNEEAVVGVVPGEWVTSHRIKLPAKTRKQFNAALPYALEELFAEDIEQLHFICPKWRVDQEITVYSVAKAKLQEWAKIANEYSIPATRIVPDYALLPEHDVAEYCLALSGERILARSKDGFGISMDAEHVSLWLKETPVNAVIAVNDKGFAEELLRAHSERDVRHWPFGERMAHWLEYPGQLDLDLWTDQLRPKSLKSLFSNYMPAALIASVAFVTMAASALFNYYSLHREIDFITQESQALVKQLIPELDYVTPGQERTYAERILAQRSQGPSGSSLPRMLVAVASVFRAEGVSLKEVRYGDETLTVSCYLTNLGQVDSVSKSLEKLVGFTVKLQGTSTEDKWTIATFIISSAVNLPGGG